MSHDQLRLLILPEYDTATPHVVVDTVYARLLPEGGHTVHMLRPIRDATTVVSAPAPAPVATLIGFPPDRPGGWLRRVQQRLRHVESGLRLLGAVPLDAVLVRNDVFGAIAARRFARRRGIPFLFQLSSPEAEFRMNGPANRLELRRAPEIARARLNLAIRRRVCRHADAVLAISEVMRRHLVTTDAVPAPQVFSFPMGLGSRPDPTPLEIDEARREMALPWRHTIAYSGVIDPLRAPSFMLDVLQRVLMTVPDAGLLVMTYQQDDRRRMFEAEAAARALPVKVIGPIHHTKTAAFVKCADVTICSVPPRLEFAMMSPTKSLEALGAGVPVVGSEDVEEHQQMLTKAGGGIAVEYDAGAFARGLVTLLADPARRERMAQAGRQWVRAYRSYPRLTRYLESILLAAVRHQPLASLVHNPDEAPPDLMGDPL